MARSPGPVAVGLVLIDASRAAHAGRAARLQALTEPRREAMAPACRGLGARLGRRARPPQPRSTSSASWRASASPARARYAALTAAQEVALDAPLISRRQLRLAEPGDRAARPGAPRASRPTATARRWQRHPSSPRCTATGGMIERRTRTTPSTAGTRTRGTRAAAHFAAIAEHGPSALHRHTWLHERPEDAPTLFDLGVG